jgi:hypothetical protein
VAIARRASATNAPERASLVPTGSGASEREKLKPKKINGIAARHVIER